MHNLDRERSRVHFNPVPVAFYESGLGYPSVLMSSLASWNSLPHRLLIQESLIEVSMKRLKIVSEQPSLMCRVGRVLADQFVGIFESACSVRPQRPMSG